MAAHWDFSAILLDMDGTLVDTETIYLASLVAALGSVGYPDGTALGHAMIGLPAPDCDAMLRSRYGPDFPFAAYDMAFARHADQLLRQGIPLKRGALALLDALRDAGCPMAIATSSSRHKADLHLSLAGIRDRFDVVVTRDDVVRGKPSPDLYLLAAARLGVSPEACVAVEDSNPGIAAAHSAGTIPIMVPDILEPTAETRARCAVILPDLHAVLALLQDRLPRHGAERS
ncbi:MAG: HAD family phosphatase [Rhizobiales bacterium]|nr:HAD family phosphatase [Hyphomicrobiales bacterium]